MLNNFQAFLDGPVDMAYAFGGREARQDDDYRLIEGEDEPPIVSNGGR